MAERLRQREVQELMKLFYLCCKNGLFKEARRIARTAHKLDPDNAPAKAAIRVARLLEMQAGCNGGESQQGKWGNGGACEPGDTPCTNPSCDPENSSPANYPKALIEEGMEGAQPGGPCEDKGIGPLSMGFSPPQGKSAMECDLKNRLGQAVTVNFQNTPLAQVIDGLHEVSGINIVPDTAALEEAGVGMDRPISLRLKNVALKTALGALLKQIHQTYVFRDDMLVITTRDNARGNLVSRAYPVADILVTAARELKDIGIQGTVEEKTAGLIKLIQTTIAPTMWSDPDGPGTIAFLPLGMCVVVQQTPDVQEQVADLLAAIRNYVPAGNPGTIPVPADHQGRCTR
jgi:hypothetical protein